MRFAKFDKTLTAAAKFKDKRSKIGLRPDGSQLVRLAGRDMEELRNEASNRDNWRCVEAIGGNVYSPLGQYCEGPLELSHDIPRGRGGSDVIDNVHMRCNKHHRMRDNREVQLRSVVRG